MEWILSSSVIKGYIDNTKKNRILGKIWLLGRDEPLELDLEGNCLSDIAGSILKFENPEPEHGDFIELAAMQTGIAGEVTASRRVQYVVGDELSSQDIQTPAGTKMSNAVYIEWYSDVNGRIVVQGIDFSVELSEPSWIMTIQEEAMQMYKNDVSYDEWIDSEINIELNQDINGKTMDEFEWEQTLKESDSLTNRFSKVLEKYIDHPEVDRMIAREMGWTWLLSDEDIDDNKPNSDCKIMEPNPDKEGVDWIKTPQGRIVHPLTYYSFRLAMDIWSTLIKNGDIKYKDDSNLHELVLQSQMLTAKLAGALDSLAYPIEIEGGFIVACLKRTLSHFNKIFSYLDMLREKNIIDIDKFKVYRSGFVEIREQVVKLMQVYRKKM